jgi:glycosyltransferase involved in cell wall biosynthesis
MGHPALCRKTVEPLFHAMKILHVVAGLEEGGLAESVPTLALAQHGLGADVSIATLGVEERLSSAARAAHEGGVHVACFPATGPRALFFSAAMLRHLPDRVRDADLVHVHSMWTFPVAYACHLARRSRKKLVLSPRGCLDPVRLEHSAWKKWIAGWLFDRHNLRTANLLHATSDLEREWIDAYFAQMASHRGRRASTPVAVVPNAISFPPEETGMDAPAASATPHATPRTVLSLGRLHPLKGLDLLLEAWGRLPALPGWRLVICGPDEQGVRAALEATAKSLDGRGAGGVEFLPPVRGEGKWCLLRSADLFVLPSRSENFGLVAGEALACGVPVICTKGAPWSELEPSPVRPRCGWWVDVDASAIADALYAAMTLSDEERAEIGGNGRRFVLGRYRAEDVARRMLDAYRAL